MFYGILLLDGIAEVLDRIQNFRRDPGPISKAAEALTETRHLGPFKLELDEEEKLRRGTTLEIGDSKYVVKYIDWNRRIQEGVVVLLEPASLGV